MQQVLDFLSDRARGFMLAMGGTGVGLSPEIIQDEVVRNSLQPLQHTVLILTMVVGIMTAISYIYRFYKFCKEHVKRKENNNQVEL